MLIHPFMLHLVGGFHRSRLGCQVVVHEGMDGAKVGLLMFRGTYTMEALMVAPLHMISHKELPLVSCSRSTSISDPHLPFHR